MKELILEINGEVARLKNYDWAGVEYQKKLFRQAVAALEAAEAKAAQYDHDRNVLYDLANKRGDTIDRLEAENAELRARVAELESCDTNKALRSIMTYGLANALPRGKE